MSASGEGEEELTVNNGGTNNNELATYSLDVVSRSDSEARQDCVISVLSIVLLSLARDTEVTALSLITIIPITIIVNGIAVSVILHILRSPANPKM